MAQAATAQRRQPDPNHKVESDRSQRWVRVMIGGETIASSRRTVLLRETGHRPVYYFPREDVRMDLLEPTDHHTHCPYKGDASYWTIKVGDRAAERSVWSYDTNVLPLGEPVRDHVAFYFDRVDAWYEEAEQIYGHPRDPYHRVDVIESTRQVRIAINGETVAETSRPRLLFETTHPTRFYIPPEDVRVDMLTATDKHTRCPYKGVASYWTVKAGGKDVPDIVWSYPEPIPECPKLTGYLSFFNEKVDVYVDGELQDRPITGWS